MTSETVPPALAWEAPISFLSWVSGGILSDTDAWFKSERPEQISQAVRALPTAEAFRDSIQQRLSLSRDCYQTASRTEKSAYKLIQAIEFYHQLYFVSTLNPAFNERERSLRRHARVHANFLEACLKLGNQMEWFQWKDVIAKLTPSAANRLSTPLRGLAPVDAARLLLEALQYEVDTHAPTEGERGLFRWLAQLCKRVDHAWLLLQSEMGQQRYVDWWRAIQERKFLEAGLLALNDRLKLGHLSPKSRLWPIHIDALSRHHADIDAYQQPFCTDVRAYSDLMAFYAHQLSQCHLNHDQFTYLKGVQADALERIEQTLLEKPHWLHDRIADLVWSSNTTAIQQLREDLPFGRPDWFIEVSLKELLERVQGDYFFKSEKSRAWVDTLLTEKRNKLKPSFELAFDDPAAYCLLLDHQKEAVISAWRMRFQLSAEYVAELITPNYQIQGFNILTESMASHGGLDAMKTTLVHPYKPLQAPSGEQIRKGLAQD